MTHELELRAINAIRFLSADAVQQANSGHPGLPMGAADEPADCARAALDAAAPSSRAVLLVAAGVLSLVEAVA